MIELIFYALLAGFVLYRLRLVLGRKDFSEPVTKQRKIDIPGILKDAKEKAEAKEAGLLPEMKTPVETDITFADQNINNIFAEIKKYDRGFSAKMFLEGAKAAFDMIIEAFAKGDKETLKSLLDDDVFSSFSKTIDERTSGFIYETKIVAIEKAEIISASLAANIAQIKIKFVSEQIDFVKDLEGRIVEGNPSDINVVNDIWVFERNIKSSDPNWKLSETDRE